MLRSTIIRVDHLCCGMEAKMIDLLDPMETVAEVEVRRRQARQRAAPRCADAGRALNLSRKHPSTVDRSVEGVGSSFTHAETVRLTVNVQLVLFAATVALECAGPQAVLAGLATVALSFALFQEAYLAVLRRSPNVELMMAIAMAGALAQGEVVEAASVGALVTLMDLVKVFALEAVGRQLRGSIVSEPLSVDVPGGGRVLLSDLAVGDVFMLRVGDVVPADGVVVAGTAAVDESRVTGEAMPQGKRTGDRVVSGAIVSSGYVHVKTEAAVASFQARPRRVEDAKATLSEPRRWSAASPRGIRRRCSASPSHPAAAVGPSSFWSCSSRGARARCSAPRRLCKARRWLAGATCSSARRPWSRREDRGGRSQDGHADDGAV